MNSNQPKEGQNSFSQFITQFSPDDAYATAAHFEDISREVDSAVEIIRANPYLFEAIRNISRDLELTQEGTNAMLRGAVFFAALVKNKYGLEVRSEEDLKFLQSLFTQSVDSVS